MASLSYTEAALRKTLVVGALRVAFVVVAALAIGTAASTEEPPLAPGSYRLEMHMASKTRLPIAGMVASSSVSISLVEIRRDGGKWIQSHRVCHFRSGENAALVKMVFPERFIASLARPTYGVDLGRDGSGWLYQADLGLEHVGFRPDGAGGKLPTAPDNPSVYDWDGDGRPGATIILSIPLFPSGELYVVQRGHSILHGRVVEPGRVEGGIDVRVFEQRVIGARPAILNYTPEIVPDSAASRFVLTRVALGSTCQSLSPVEQSVAEGEATP
jgi:hypothetical protein